MSNVVLESPRAAAATTGKVKRRRARTAKAAKIVGGILSFSALALGSAQFTRFSGMSVGPGAILPAMPKIVGEAVAPFVAATGAAGVACGLSALWLERKAPQTTGTKKRRGLGAGLIVAAGMAAAAMGIAYTQQVLAVRGDFAAAFGPGWEQQIPASLQDGMLPRRWAWKLPAARGAHVERDVVFATVPGTDRKLPADVWTPPDGVAPSGLGFIYLHGGGYSAFDKGGPTEPWFRHLAAQGHTVMNVAYRLIPEATVPEMQGDVKRAVAWLKRNAARYGVDPGKIVLSGGSGGSHLALLAAYAPHHPPFTPEDVRGADLSVRGVIAYYLAGDYRPEVQPAYQRSAFEWAVADGMIRFMELWTGSKLAVNEQGGWDAPLLLGGTPEQWPELYRQISPIVHVGPDTPPTLQFVGSHDVYVSRTGFELVLHRKLQEAGVPSVYVEYPRTDHAFDMFLPQFSPAAQSAMYDVDRFLALMASGADWK